VELDAGISGFIGMLPWSRFQIILTAAIEDADPDLAAEREGRARHARDVWACDSDDGLRTLIAKANSGDVVWWFLAGHHQPNRRQSSPWTAIRTRLAFAGRKPSASSPNPRTP
jgi:hypothetical protein